jgi:altronate hydrolase
LPFDQANRDKINGRIFIFIHGIEIRKLKKLNQDFIRIDPADNVLVALKNLPVGHKILFTDYEITVKDFIPAKHKLFIENLLVGDEVIMYGVLVGKVTKDVLQGSLMTTNNIEHATQPYDANNFSYKWQPPDISKFRDRTFNGYLRNDGRVGTANYWLFIPTVFCENRNLDVIKEAMQRSLGYAVTDKYNLFTKGLKDAFVNGIDIKNFYSFDVQPTPKDKRLFENVDGIKFLNHQGGCGGTRQDSEKLSRLLAAYADHPNVGGVTLLSLGCQHLQVENFMNDLKSRNPDFDKPLLIFEQQQSLSEEQLVKQAIHQTFIHLIEIDKIRRQPVGLENLTIGVKCGGSDGFSGISANPAVGYTADLVVALGGKVLLAEFPELCGVEQNLVDRCVNQEIAKKFISLMKNYDEQARLLGSGFHMNPSPGNIKDGLITDAIKSAGAAKKGGTAPITDVLDYSEPAINTGLNLVCTPGNDVEATTGKAASGATLILFTTGLGTPTGNPVCPVIKISSNTPLANRMGDIIDLDCGPVIEGLKTIEQMGEEILEYCIKVAGGERTPKAVLLGQDDFIPWKKGVSL